MRCHVCSSLAHSKNIFHLKGLVSSDCQPANISCNIFYCDKCELVQKEIDAEWLNAADNIYQNYKIYHQAAGEEQKVRSLDGLKFESRSELIVHWLSNKLEAHQFGELLDVGCGNGAFLRVFNSKFGAWSLTGSEIGDKYKQDILNIDDNVEFLDASLLFESQKKYDLISLIHCIEHISEPHIFLKNLKQKMSPSGLLFIQVPDVSINPFDLAIADHASHFSKISLKNLLISCGFNIIECGNFVLDKEISLLANLASDSLYESEAGGEFLANQIGVLRDIYKQFDELPDNAILGIFGSSIAATWLGSMFKDKFSFFVDEDFQRIGNIHLGKPIFSPDEVPEISTIYIPLEKKLSESIYLRLKSSGLKANIIRPAI